MRHIAVSIETTGFEPSQGHRIIEIGCVEIIEGALTGNNFHVYLRPDRELDESAIIRSGITPEFLGDKPRFEEVCSEFVEYISGAELITHDASFVIGFLDAELLRVDSGNKNPKIVTSLCSVVDLFVLAKQFFPTSNNSLPSLAKRLFVEDQERELFGALLRAEVIGEIFLVFTSSQIEEFAASQHNENRFEISSFAEFIEATGKLARTVLCRGVSNSDYLLIPSLFRNSTGEDPDVLEEKLMWVFKTHARAFLAEKPDSELEWLTIAQHHGLPTRLLDWTLSPLVACYFAVYTCSDSEACVYIYDTKRYKKEESVRLKNLTSIVPFIPTHATRRVTSQSGIFTVHPTKKKLLESSEITKLVIPGNLKSEFKEKLSKFGIHHGTLFPDLDGLSQHIRYLNGY